MIGDIWRSFRALPGWVQIWVFAVLVPVNLASVLYLDQPHGGLVAALAIGAILPNAALMLVERGFSKAMALSHIAIWPFLIVVVLWLLAGDGGASRRYLWLLLVVDLVSLGFDFPDAWAWLKGARAVAGREAR